VCNEVGGGLLPVALDSSTLPDMKEFDRHDYFASQNFSKMHDWVFKFSQCKV
jgi:hypothetical protein